MSRSDRRECAELTLFTPLRAGAGLRCADVRVSWPLSPLSSSLVGNALDLGSRHLHFNPECHPVHTDHPPEALSHHHGHWVHGASIVVRCKCGNVCEGFQHMPGSASRLLREVCAPPSPSVWLRSLHSCSEGLTVHWPGPASQLGLPHRASAELGEFPEPSSHLKSGLLLARSSQGLQFLCSTSLCPGQG